MACYTEGVEVLVELPCYLSSRLLTLFKIDPAPELHKNFDSFRVTSHSFSPVVTGTSRGYTRKLRLAAVGIPSSTHCLTLCISRSLAAAFPYAKRPSSLASTNEGSAGIHNPK